MFFLNCIFYLKNQKNSKKAQSRKLTEKMLTDEKDPGQRTQLESTFMKNMIGFKLKKDFEYLMPIEIRIRCRSRSGSGYTNVRSCNKGNVFCFCKQQLTTSFKAYIVLSFSSAS